MTIHENLKLNGMFILLPLPPTYQQVHDHYGNHSQEHNECAISERFINDLRLEIFAIMKDVAKVHLSHHHDHSLCERVGWRLECHLSNIAFIHTMDMFSKHMNTG